MIRDQQKTTVQVNNVQQWLTRVTSRLGSNRDGKCQPHHASTTPASADGFRINKLALFVLIACIGAASVHAATHTWTGAGFFGNQDFLWSNPGNWSPVGAPTVGETNLVLIFPNTAAPRRTTNDIAGLNVAGIQFLGTNYEIHASPAGTTLRLNGGAGGAWAILAAADGCVIGLDSPIWFQTTGTVSVAEDLIFEMECNLAGPGGFTKTGPGLQFLFGEFANTYTGPTIVVDGALCLRNGYNSPSGNGVTAVSGPLIVGPPLGITIPTVRALANNQFSPSAPVTILGGGDVSFWGTTNALASLVMENGSSLSTASPLMESLWPGLLELHGNVTVNPSQGGGAAIISGRLALGAVSRTFNVSGSGLDILADISGSSANAGITKSGSGTLDLRGVNTYDGPTLIQAGKVTVGFGPSNLGSTVNGTTVSAGATLSLAWGNDYGSEALTLNGAPGVITLDCSDGHTNSFSGPVTVNGPCEIKVEAWYGGSLTFSGAVTGSGSLRKTAAGRLEFAGFGGNTFSGGLFAEEGLTRMNKSASAPALAGPLVVGATNSGITAGVFVEQINQIPDASTITLFKNGLLDGDASDTLGNLEFFGGSLAGQTFTLNGHITNHLVIGTHGDIESALLLAAGTHFVHCDANAQLNVTGVLQGNAAITKTGAGELQFLSTNTYSGVTIVQGGVLTLEGAGRPGSTAAGTFVAAGGRLQLSNCAVTNETLTLNGALADGDGLWSSTFGRWAGPIVLNGGGSISSSGPLQLEGGISGNGGLKLRRITGAPAGYTDLIGSSPNTYTGTTTVLDGIVELGKTAGPAIPGDLIIGGGIGACVVRLLQADQIASTAAVTILSGAGFGQKGFAQTIGSLSGDGGLTLDTPGTFTIGANGNSTTFAGVIDGFGALTKTGAGTLTLSGDNPYSGSTMVNGGTLIVNGQQQFSSVSVLSGAKLGGNGRVGNLAVNTGATIAPGASPGVLSCGNANLLSSGAALQIEINGTTPGAYYQLAVNGAASMIGGSLQVLMNIGGAVSNQYVIVSNDGADSVSGTFTGLPEGASITNQGAAFVITYHGGDGNDIALIQQTVGYVSRIVSGAKLPNGRFAITALGAPNTTYRVDACTNLAPPVVWTQIGSAAANASGNISFSDVSAPSYPIRFYRLRYP